MFYKFFEKISNTKFQENLSSGSPVVPGGWKDGQAVKLKLVFAFRNFETLLKSYILRNLVI